MHRNTFQVPESRFELTTSLLLGAGFAIALFVVMALPQLLRDVTAPKSKLEETMMAFNAPEVIEIEEKARRGNLVC